ncbi:hypothetical protein [Streptomyces sp. 8K308]|uniref:hypothetical protein n=1 Tax=Streptomyces sp. 8K308 TaxID=2530388 RepID=UPI001FB5D760|nr:hypothetical protein [Streptomyces sp. 8K308]
MAGNAGLSGAGGDSRWGYGGVARASAGAGTTSRGRGAGAGGALSYEDPYDGAPGGHGLVVVELYG